MAIKLFALLVLCLLTAGVYAEKILYPNEIQHEGNYDDQMKPVVPFTLDPGQTPTVSL